MSDMLVQIRQDTVCVKCFYVVVDGSVMHCIEGKYYCAVCAKELREEVRRYVFE